MIELVKEIFIEVYDPTKGSMEDDAWVELAFDVPLSFELDELSTGYRGGWKIDGPITDKDGYEFDEDDINEMCVFFDNESTGFDWDTLFSEAYACMSNMITKLQIDAYEARHFK